MTNWGALAGTALLGAGAYFDYKNKRDQQRQLDREYSAYRYQQMQRAALGGGPSRGGGGGGGGESGKDAMRSILLDYYQKAQDLYQPYVDAGRQVLPLQSAAYQKGLEGAGGFMGKTLDPQFLQQALTYNRPDGPALPEYLRGGKK